MRHDLCSSHEDVALKKLLGRVREARTLLATQQLPKFLTTPDCEPLVHSLFGVPKDIMFAQETSWLSFQRGKLIWPQYHVPPDAEGWLIPLASVAETLPVVSLQKHSSFPRPAEVRDPMSPIKQA